MPGVPAAAGGDGGTVTVWAKALLTAKAQTPPTAKVKMHVFLDMSLSLSSVEIMMCRKAANETFRQRTTLLNKSKQYPPMVGRTIKDCPSRKLMIACRFPGNRETLRRGSHPKMMLHAHGAWHQEGPQGCRETFSMIQLLTSSLALFRVRCRLFA
jgi:hypothetical protein